MQKLVCFIVCLLWFMTVITDTVKADIIPTPKTIIPKNGSYEMPRLMNISFLNDPNNSTLPAASIINEALIKQFGIKTSLEFEATKSQILLKILTGSEINDRINRFKIPESQIREAYILAIFPDKIVIEGFTDRGVFYGAITLAQIISQSKTKSIDQQYIADWPDLKMRGISEDISQSQIPNIANFKKIIDQLAWYKLNTYFLYIEDVFSFDNFTAIGKDRNALQKSQIKELVAYAEKKYIDIIPIFETLGNQENILNINQFQSITEFPGASTLCIACPYTYVYLDLVISEIAEVFRSQYIHIGMAHSHDAGFGESEALVKELGGLAALHRYHYQKVTQICKKYNKQTIIYGDILLEFPENIDALQKDGIVMYQPSDNKNPSQKTIEPAKDTIPYLISAPAYNTKSIFPQESKSFLKIKQLSSFSKQSQAQGFITYNKGEMDFQAFKEFLYPTYTWTGHYAWSSDTLQTEAASKNHFQDTYPEEIQEIRQLHQHFAEAQNTIYWNEFWRHPALEAQPTFISDSSSLAERRNILLHTLSQTQPLLDSLAFVFVEQDSTSSEMSLVQKQVALYRLHQHFISTFADKISMLEEVQDLRNDKVENIFEMLGRIENITIDLASLKEEYRKVWEQYYAPGDNLELILNKFDALITYYFDLKQGVLFSQVTNPLLKSKWISDCPTEKQCANTATFRTLLYLNAPPNRAILQYLTNTYAELYINGQFVDKSFVRNAKNNMLETEKIRFINIKNYLIEGDNEIVFRVRNYNQGLLRYGLVEDDAASVNATGYITLDNGKKISIDTDTSWQVKVENESNKVSNWKKAHTKDIKLEIIAPDFVIEMPSQIVH